MANNDLARTLDAVVNRRHVIVGLTTELRPSVSADVEKAIEREGAVDGVVRLLRGIQPQNSEAA